MNTKPMICDKRAIIYESVLLSALCSSLAVAEDYEVLGGTFTMEGDPNLVSVAPDSAITTLFSDTTPAFNGDFNCTSTSVPTPDSLCLGTNPDSTATNNGLNSFTFFGGPTFNYFARTGIDAGNHPPPSIDLTNSGLTEFSSFYANWNGTEFNQGAGPSKGTTVGVTNNFDGTYTLAWDSLIVGGPFNGLTGTWSMTLRCLTCPSVEVGLSPNLSVDQQAVTTRTVLATGGNFTVSTDLTSTTGYGFDWSSSDPAVLNGQVSAGSTLVVDPSGISPGFYEILVTTTNGNVVPNQAARSSLVIQVVSSGDLTQLGDSDNDGIQNVNDSIDNTATPTLQQAEPNNAASFVLESSAGKLESGRTAGCVGSQSVRVTATDVQTSGGALCSAPGNAVDEVVTVRVGIGGYFDFVVKNLAQGAQVDVVVPVGEPLPINASYRKYHEVDGWLPFDTSSGDSITSAPGSSGQCPPPTDAAWSNGLTSGHNCVRLSITDGGPNDTDGDANGIVADPGAVSYNPGAETYGTTIGGILWLLFGAPLLWLRKRK